MKGHNKKLSLMASGMAAMLSCVMLFSCTNEDFLGENSPEKVCDNICFGVSSDVNPSTKGIANGENEITTNRFVLRSDNSADTLCVRTIVSEGINVSDFESKQAITRGTPLTAEGLNKFHVLAYRKVGEEVMPQFYMDEDATKKGDIWSTEKIYYWPGAEHWLQFYAWAPTDAKGLTTPSSPASKVLTYTVPTDVNLPRHDASIQKDIVVATTDEISGNTNAAVPLTFKHICTAVRFVVGGQMQPGTIQSVTLKGVKNAGTYDMAAGTWSLDESTDDFTQALNKETTGDEVAEEVAITSEEETFMMLPQTLPAGAMVEVVFTNASGAVRTLTASIGSTKWEMGTTVTYSLSITPEYNFELTDENPVLDAHYEIFKTTLKVTDMPAGTQWTVTANSDATIILQSALNDYAKQGFWTDRFKNNQTDAGSARGAASFTGTGSGEFPIAIFVPENAGKASRTIDLSIKVANSNEIVETLVLTQLAPSWNENEAFGCERIESDPCQWGFYWSSDFKIIYDLTSCDNTSRENIYDYIAWTKTLKSLSENRLIGWLVKWIFGNDIPDLSFVSMESTNISTSWVPNYIANKITIDLGSISTSGIALSPGNGQSNTAEIYNFKGISLVNDIISRVESISGYEVATEGTGVFPSHNASIACMKLNSWDVVTVQENTILQLKTEKPSWYLPAQTEAPQMTDTEYPLSGTYWTSTAENNNQNAYIWNAGKSSANSVAQRDEYHKVRAVRKKP